MTLKNDEKFEKELSCRFKTGMKNLMNFDTRTQKPHEICTLMGRF